MTDAELLEIAERAVRRAGGEAHATAVHERSLLSRFAHSRPTQATAVDELDVRVLCVRDGHTALAHTNGTAEEDLRAAGAAAAAAAETAARAGGPGPYPGLPALDKPPRAHDGWDPGTAPIDPAEAGRGLEKVFGVAAERGLEAAGVWTAGAVRTAVANSAGVRATDSVTDVYLKVICLDASGRSGFAAQAGRGVGELDPEAAAAEAAAKVSAEEPVELEPGDYEAVLEPEAVGELLRFLGSLALNGLAFAENRSALSGRLGERVTAPSINLSDSPRHPSTLPRAFDAEGVPKAPLPLIQDGVAHRVVHDTRSAAIAGGGARTTGHATQPGGSPEGPVPRNLVLAGGGAAGVDELVAPVQRGIYVTRLWYVNPVQPRRTLLTGMTRDGTFLIEDGRIARPLRDVRFTDTILGLLERTEALSAGTRLVCEGDFYGRRFATGAVCPAIRVGSLRVTGATV